MPQQNVSIPHQLQEFVETMVESGLYSTKSEVHNDALRDLKDKIEMSQQSSVNDKALAAHAEKGLRDYEEGRHTEINSDQDLDNFFDDIDKEVSASEKETA